MRAEGRNTCGVASTSSSQATPALHMSYGHVRLTPSAPSCQYLGFCSLFRVLGIGHQTKYTNLVSPHPIVYTGKMASITFDGHE